MYQDLQYILLSIYRYSFFRYGKGKFEGAELLG